VASRAASKRHLRQCLSLPGHSSAALGNSGLFALLPCAPSVAPCFCMLFTWLSINMTMHHLTTPPTSESRGVAGLMRLTRNKEVCFHRNHPLFVLTMISHEILSFPSPNSQLLRGGSLPALYLSWDGQCDKCKYCMI
jgi:hypothetical protein